MKAEQLWASILQEAIQGRLVPQLESEPEVTQIGKAPNEVPFEIPEKWKWVQLGNIGRWKAGGTPSRSNKDYYNNGTIPWLKTGDLTDGLINRVEEYITDEALKNSSAHINPKGSVLIAMYGATIGKLGLLKFPCATNQACCACDVNTLICDRWYLFYFLESQRKEFIAKGAGGAQPNISRTKIVNHLIPLPPIEEQKRIVARIQILRPLIELYKQEEKQLEVIESSFPKKLRASILQEAIQGKLVPQLESEPEVTQIGEAPNKVPFEIPEKWKWVRLNEVGKIVGGGTPKTSLSEYWEGGTILWFTPADLGKVQGLYAFDSARKITALGLKESSAVMMPPNSVLFSSRAPIGHIALAADNCCTNQGCKSYVPNIEFVEPLWGYFVMKARTPDMIARASGTTFKEISGKGVGETLIPIPPIEEQRRIIAKLNELLGVVDQLEKTISAT